MKMTKYTAYISEDQISDLKKLFKENVYIIYSPWLAVSGSKYEGVGYSINLDNDKWINIKNVWKETPDDNSYWELDIELSDDPYEIQISENRFLKPVSSIFLGGKENISKIEIYEYTYFSEKEIIAYDKAIVFYKETSRFCISVLESVADCLIFNSEDKNIESEIANCNLRMTLQPT
jgi:hypothetical protein